MSSENNDGDEELMSDFQDLFEEEETTGGAASEAASADESLDELDAFLDDFEKNLDVPDTPTEEEGRSDKLELDKEALDLDVGLDGEVYAEEPVLDEGEESLEEAVAESADSASADEDLLDLDAMMDESPQPQEVVQEELVLETPAPEPIAAAASTASAAVASAVTSPSVTPPPPAAISKGQMIIGATVIGASLLLSVSALWMGLSLGTRIETLNESVGELQQRVMAQSRRGSLSATTQLGDQVNQLGQRVSELAVIVEGPVGHLRERNQQALEALSQRLDTLEKGQSKAVTPTVASRQPKPLVSKAAPEAAAAVAPRTAQSKQAWVINLLSVTSAKTASEELARLRKMGIRADKQTVNKDGKSWYRLRVTGFDSYEGAKAYIDTVEKQTGFKSAWVAKE